MPSLPPVGATSGAAARRAGRRPRAAAGRAAADVPADPLADEDLQLALYFCYELHYRGFDGVDERWEWDPGLLAFRARLEDGLRGGAARRGRPARRRRRAAEMDLALRAIAEADDAPSLSRYIERAATLEQLREFLMHRSAYQLKEADPHSWAIPRLTGRPEGGDGRDPGRRVRRRPPRAHPRRSCSPTTHARRSASTTPTAPTSTGSPAITLATVNLMSLCGLHRRWRGAIVGHLALFEMTSSVPNRRYASGLRRLGFDARDDRVLRRARRGRRRARGDRRRRPRRRAGRQEPALAPTSCGARARSSTSRAAGRAHVLDALGARRVLAARRSLAVSGLAPRPACGALKPRELVRAVAERPQPRAAAAAQRDRLRPPRSRRRPGPDRDVAAHEQRPVAVGRHDHGPVRHTAVLPG